jgi:hypothetical protein
MPHVARIARRTGLGLVLLLTLSSTALAQTAPSDFDLQGWAGGLVPGSDNTWVHILKSGQCAYVRVRPDSLTLAPLDSVAFTLSATQVDQVWHSVSNHGFFSLATSYSDPSFAERSFARLTIRASATTRTVVTTNIAVAAFDAIVATVDSLTPGAHDLIYETSPPVAYTPQDGCGNPAFVPSPAAPTSGFDLDAARAAGLGKRATLRATSAGHDGPPETTADLLDAGAVMAYHISLADAVGRGIVTLTSKGNFFGDQMSLTVDNTSGVTASRLTLDLNLDLFGPDATTANANGVRADILAKWDHWSGNGVPIDVQVHENVVSGNSAPGNAGYDQILLGDKNTTPSVAVSATTPTATINSGTAVGAWSVSTPEYGHEVGHLMGLPDRYTDYRRQPDNSWKPEGGGSSLNTDQLASALGPTYPQFTHAEIISMLGLPSNARITVPLPGHEDDIMGHSDRLPLQSDLNALAAQAGLVVDIPAGQVFTNKDGTAQNLMTTREIHMFIPKGQVRTINGLWVACIDLDKHSPDFGTDFDLAPPISQWTGSPAAAAMQKLLDYGNAHALFCDDVLQSSIWDISESSGASSAADSALFIAAGVTLPLPDGFPHLSVLNRASRPQLVNPRELYLPAVAIGPSDVVTTGHSVGLTARIPGAGVLGASANYQWSLDRPSGSTASPSPATGSISSFQADRAGYYRVHLHSQVTTPSDTFSTDTTRDVVCADARTETFESGTIRSGAPFHWLTAGDSAWSIDGTHRHTGSYCAVAPFAFSGALDHRHARRAGDDPVRVRSRRAATRRHASIPGRQHGDRILFDLHQRLGHRLVLDSSRNAHADVEPAPSNARHYRRRRARRHRVPDNGAARGRRAPFWIDRRLARDGAPESRHDPGRHPVHVATRDPCALGGLRRARP